MEILHLGCGKKKYPGAFGVDISSDSSADLVHDLNKRPWPLDDNRFDKVYCIDVIEHVDSVIDFMEEVYRVTRHGAEIVIQAPFPSGHYLPGDPTHKRGFTSKSLRYFDDEFVRNYYHYSDARFKTLEISYNKYEKWIWNYRPGRLDRILTRWADTHKDLYERRFMWIYPIQNIYYRLQTLKK